MAEFLVQTPGQPDRTVRLERWPATIGRGEDCEVQIAEIRSSRRHARLTRLPDGRGFAIEDLGSSNGTLVGSDRVLRRRLQDGDVVRIGETTLTLRAPEAAAAPAEAAPPSPSAAPVFGGRVRVEEVVPGAEPPPAVPPGPARPPAGARRRGDDRVAVRRSAIFLGVGVLLLVGVEALVPSLAAKRRAPAVEAGEYTKILSQADLSFETLEDDVARFEAEHPRSRFVPILREYVGARRARETRRRAAEDELERLQRLGDSAPASEQHARLLALRRQNPDLPVVVRRVDLALEAVSRSLRSAAERDGDAAVSAADAALARGDPGAALRALSSFHARHPGAPDDLRARLFAKEEALLGEVRRIADEAVAAAAATPDLDARRERLARALPGLAGTIAEDRVRDALRAGVPGGGTVAARPPVAGGTTPGAPTPGSPTPAGPAPTPRAPEPTVSAAVVAKAAEAERFARTRAWAAAAGAYESLATAEAPPALKAEWSERGSELRRIASLVADLDATVQAAGDKPPRVKIGEATVEVVAATSEAVSLRRGGETATHAWGSLSPSDVLALLVRPKPSPDQRLAAALLAADLGDRAAAMEQLVPLVEVESHRDLAFRTVARRLEGRREVPEGGYSVDGADLVDRAELARRTGARKVAALEAEAGAIVGKLAAEPAYKKLENVREKRDELDKRRLRALIAIFNEKHYPYPKESAPTEYAVVQEEIDRRISAVEEVWNDPVSAHPGKAESVRRLLARHVQVVDELRKAGKDPAPLLEAVRPYALHATGEPLTIRTYFRDEEERKAREYSRWVMRDYNPLKNEVATEAEREQVRVTNEYRMMMGWQLVVEPSGAAIQAIEGTSVAKILDEGVERHRTLLLAVRIDDRLVRSARGHSEDMDKRGYFAHEGRPDPSRNLPATTPFERMASAGYSGNGASENIAAGRGDPMSAHMAWRQSSGHHRNLLSFWVDMGSGQSGGLWTQNFGIGGGPEPVIPGRKPTDETVPVEEVPVDPPAGEPEGGDPAPEGR